MSVREKIKEQLRLEEEYTRIVENEAIYYDEIALWNAFRKIFLGLIFISFILMIIPAFSLPQGIPVFDLFPEYPLQVGIFFFGVGLFFTSIAAELLLSNKIVKIEIEIGLDREERLYLRAYETHKNIDAFLNESNLKRKLYFKKLALESVQEKTKIVEGLQYGNIHLITNLIGDQIDLLKDNMKRLILSNVAKGKETALTEISKILLEFCKYILSPSVEKLSELNNMIKDLPYVKYEVKTRKQRISNYFRSKPRFSLLLFSSLIVAIIVVVMFYLELDMGVIFAVAVGSFLGTFTVLDKLFRLTEK